MLARLEAQVAEQQRFAANASHELRTPLAITQTLLDVARNDPDRDTASSSTACTPSTPGRSTSPRRCCCSAAPTSGPSPASSVDLSLLAEEAAETLLPLAEQRGITIVTSGDATPTVGSAALLLQLVTNLVHNAIVHNLPDRRHRVGHDRRAPRHVRARRSRTPARRSRRSWSPRSPSRSSAAPERVRTDHAGVGLGLAIVTSIVHAHDGTLDLAPRAGGGLSSRCRLPRAAGTDPAHGRVTAPARSVRARRGRTAAPRRRRRAP